MFYVSRKMKLLPGVKTIQDYRRIINPHSIDLVHRSFGKNAQAMVAAYLKENPDQLSDEDLTIIESWKDVIHGDFVVAKELAKYAVLLDCKDLQTGYGVLATENPISCGLFELPSVVEATLYPFCGQIVAIVTTGDLLISSSTMRHIKNTYEVAKKRGFITTLGPVVPKSRKKPNPAERVQNLVNLLHNKLKEIRKQTLVVKKFESDIQPAFKSWVDTHFGAQRKMMDDLDAEIEQLQTTIIQAREAWNRGKFDTIEEAIAHARKQAKANQDKETEFKKSESGPNFSEDFLDEAFAEFMDDVRGIDVDDLEEADYQKFRQEFQETVKNANSGSKDAFEKSLGLIGANDSEENVSAVKKLFRILARKIHPDRNPDFGEEAQEIWNELNFARECLDLNTMEELHLRWRLLQKEEFLPQDEADLKEFQNVLNEELNEARQVIEAYSDHPLWGATEFKPPRGLKNQLAREFEEEIEQRTAQRDMFERMLKELARKAAKKPSPSKKKRPKAKKKTTKKTPGKKGVPEQTTFDF